jgi:ABC-2 type transport system ATP-binding protein
MSTGEAICLQGLTRRFGELTAVNDLSFEVHSGEILGLLGPNGAGKTTTIRMLTGALRPSSGRVMVYGEEARSGSPDLKRRIGVCPQEPVLWERLSCTENLTLLGCMYGIERGEVRRRTRELLDALGLTDNAGVRTKKLSGGMKKRLNLAMALIHDPEIIVLDEPITGLDPQSRLLVSDYIHSLCRESGKTVILSTHLMEVAATVCNRVAIIDHGELLVLDSIETLSKSLGGGDVVELTLNDAEKTEAALAMARSLDGIEGAVEHNGGIRFQALGAVAMLPDLLVRLHEMGAEIENLSLRPNTLEDIFISLTGRGLRD